MEYLLANLGFAFRVFTLLLQAVLRFPSRKDCSLKLVSKIYAICCLHWPYLCNIFIKKREQERETLRPNLHLSIFLLVEDC